ncbi:MAG: acylphosphatase [Nocardioidaceae bacterium]
MSTSGVIAREAVVHGLVQGVFFRATCQQEAERLGVSGWARNESDGTVRVFLEGAPEDVESMLAWCRRGPRQAAVDRVEVVERTPREESGFSVD